MIKKFWDTCDEEESTMTSVDSAKAQAILDTAMLEQYIDLVGPKLITDGLAVFEKMMPGYLSVLESNLTARDQKGIVEEGIKSKVRPVRSVYATCNSWVNRFSRLIYLHGKITWVIGLKR
jgi:hypothetical protein